MESFELARQNGATVHDSTLRGWALNKARELNFDTFKSSHYWLNKFKRIHRISSRKIVKFISTRQQKNLEEIENSALDLMLDYHENVKEKFDPFEIFNTGQSGFQYFLHTNRTLSFTNERSTSAIIQNLNSRTHSYTIQPLLNMDGRLVGKLYVNLKEIANEFGPRVRENLPNYSNLYVTCTTSGKLTKNLIQQWSQNVFKDVVNDLHSNRVVLYVDSWGGQNDTDLYKIDGKQVELKIFPPCTTSILQPLDLYCFHMWKDFIKRFNEQVLIVNYDIEIHLRANILKIQSLIYNQFQCPDFRPMWLCGWRLAGFEVPEIPFESLKKTLFEFNEDCSTENCLELPFIKCIYCKKVLCLNCFFVNYHFH
jgi:hypothetical protein